MKRMIIDSTRCSGCGKCLSACAEHFRDGISRILLRKDQKGRFVPLTCRQCPEPACMQGCMSGAISRNPETGHLRYQAEHCAKCYMCVMNCPYGIPFPTRYRYVARCDFCDGEVSGPACVHVCSEKAIYLEETS